MNTLRTITLAAALIAINADAQTIISVNLDENQGRRPMTASDLAGVSADSTRVANWNNLNSVNNGALTGDSAIYDDGSTVGGAFEVVLLTDRQTFQGETSLINDPQMYSGSTQIWQNDTMSLDLTGIPFSNYDIYVFTTGGSSTRGGSIGLNGGTTYYNRGGGKPDASGNGYTLITTTSFNPSDPSAVGSGNYVHFDGLSGSSQTINVITLDMGDASTQRQAIHGFQIVQVPEPSTYALAFGAIIILAAGLRRRNKLRQ